MCVFCEIIKGNIPSSKIYEDEDFIAILDLSQLTKGHTIVMPKKHYENFLLMPEDLLAKYLIVIKEITKKLDKTLKPNGYNVLSNINEISGQSVMHAHIHIIPRYDENDGFGFKSKQTNYKLDEIEKIING